MTTGDHNTPPPSPVIHFSCLNVNAASQSNAWLHWTSDHDTDKIPRTFMGPKLPKSSKPGCFSGYICAPSPVMSRHRPGLLEWCVTLWAPIPDTPPNSPNNLHFIVSLWKLYSLFFRVIYLFPLCMANFDCQIDCTQNQLRGIPLNCRWGNLQQELTKGKRCPSRVGGTFQSMAQKDWGPSADLYSLLPPLLAGEHQPHYTCHVL